MVSTAEVRELANASDFETDKVYTIKDEFKVRQMRADPANPESDIRKRLSGHLTGIELPVLLNNTSRKAIEAKFSSETKNWIGKKLKCLIADQNVRGTMTKVLYFTPV